LKVSKNDACIETACMRLKAAVSLYFPIKERATADVK